MRAAVTLLAMASLVPPASAAGRSPRAISSGAPNSNARAYRLDGELTKRAGQATSQTTKVIVTLVPGADVPAEFQKFIRGSKLDILNGQVLEVPNSLLTKLASYPGVFRVHYDRPIKAHNYRTSITIGADLVRDQLGYTGAGIGVAVIDSGIASWHDDLTPSHLSFNRSQYLYGLQRVAKFVDFVNGRSLPYDDNGHGTHVSGIILGNGADSNGEKSGAAPDATLVSLKVLDQNGVGTISNIIAAMDWVVRNAQTYNIRVVNLSVGAAVQESYFTDPLTLAAKRLTDRGIVVVAAAGNLGKNGNGDSQWGGITAPGNAPWVLTVGASSTMGTFARGDDQLARFSSSGPTAFDYGAKPDLVAPGVGTMSLAAPGSTLVNLASLTNPLSLISGTSLWGSAKPYLTLSGTSMSAPVVSGTVALMLQANPSLTPNLVKAILEYTAEEHPDDHPLSQGAGYLNTIGAVKLAAFYAHARPGDPIPTQGVWSRHIIWGNHEIAGGLLIPAANAWDLGTTWGAAQGFGDDNIVWGTACGFSCDNIVWGTWGTDDNIVWGTFGTDNVVWGTWGGADNIVWGTWGSEDNIVWGTWGGDNVVWGTDCGGFNCDNVVWGTWGDDNIVWGTGMFGDNVVWGTWGDADNIVWGTWGLDNVVWGTFGADNVVWGTFGLDNIVWGTTAGTAAAADDGHGKPLPDPTVEFADPNLRRGTAATGAGSPTTRQQQPSATRLLYRKLAGRSTSGLGR